MSESQTSTKNRPLRVGWHREHFLSPLLQFQAQDAGQTFELVECPGGTGEMQVKMRGGEIDLCIALTDALIAGLANGQTAYQIVGQYISSPLRWAMITGKDSQYNSVNDLKGTTFGISRLGSGSQVMASVLSLQQGWSEADQPKFKVEGQFKPLRDSVNAGNTSIFLWEWFTTKPFVDSGEVRFIGHVDTTPSTPGEQIKQFITSLQPYVSHFDSAEARKEEDIQYVSKTFGQREEDVREWIKTVKWADKLDQVDVSVVQKTLSILTKAGVVQERDQWNVQDFVRSEVASII